MAKDAHKKGIIQKTPVESLAGGVPFLSENDFRDALFAHGYEVTHEKAMRCGCVNKPTGQPLSNCCNCIGTGWFFINKTATRMLVQGINKTTNYKDWTEDDRGTSSISARAEDNVLSFMDRVTVLDAESHFVESLKTIEASDNTIYAYLYYYPLEIYAVYLFKGVNVPHQLLDVNDYTIDENKIVFDSALASNYSLNKSNQTEDGKYLNFMIAYNYNPVYHLIDITREVVKNRNRKCSDGKLELKYFPVNAIAKKAHFIMDAPDFDGDSVFDNSFLEAVLDSCDLLLQRLSKKDRLECILPTYVFSDTDTQDSTDAVQQNDMRDWLCVAAGYANTHSLFFDGINDRLTFPDTGGEFAAIDRGQAIYISVWVKISAYHNGTIYAKGSYSVGSVGQRFIMTSSGALFFSLHNSGLNRLVVQSDAADIPLNVWCLCAVSYTGSSDGAGVSLRINGLDVTSNVVASPITASIANSAKPTIGDSEVSSFPFAGYMTEPRMYKVAKNAAFSLAEYGAGKPTEATDKINTLFLPRFNTDAMWNQFITAMNWRFMDDGALSVESFQTQNTAKSSLQTDIPT